MVKRITNDTREGGLGAAAWILCLRNEYGIFEKVSYGGCVLKNALAMLAEREALRKGIEHLTVLLPTVVRSFVFQVENLDRTGQYKLNAQSLRPFGLHSDVNDAHRAGASRLQNKNKRKTRRTTSSLERLFSAVQTANKSTKRARMQATIRFLHRSRNRLPETQARFTTSTSTSCRPPSTSTCHFIKAISC